jgi:hypothetical protein
MGRNDEAEALERLRDLADETIAQVRRIPKEASQAAGGGAKQARQHADRARERAALAKRRELAAHAERSTCRSRRPRCRNVSAILTRAARARAHAEHARELQGLALKEQREQEG